MSNEVPAMIAKEAFQCPVDKDFDLEQHKENKVRNA